MNKVLIEKNFSRCAATYDTYANIQQQAARELAGQLADRQFENILEIGSGTGNYSLLLRHNFKSARIRAFDISARMVETARDKLKGEKIDFFQADAENLNLEERFDLITSNACLHWVGNLGVALSLFKQLLKQNGTIAFSIFGPLTFSELREALRAAVKEEAVEAKNFSDKEKITSLMRKYFNGVTVREKCYQENYGNLQELLYKIKFTGTGGNGLTGKIHFSRGLLQQIETEYLAKFGAIIATYQVFFCQGAGK